MARKTNWAVLAVAIAAKGPSWRLEESMLEESLLRESMLEESLLREPMLRESLLRWPTNEIPEEKEMPMMALFGKKDNSNKPSSCCCVGNCDAESMQKAAIAKTEGAAVKVLGSGCAKCNQLEAAAKSALEQLGMDTTIDHVTDFAQIAAYGVMTTPALVVNGKVVSYGKVLKTDEIVKILLQVGE
jgi:small redox-active disulfide protein 2